MRTFAKIVLGTLVCGTTVSIILATFNTFVMRVEWLDTKKESDWPQLFTYKDAAYWVAPDASQPGSWVILGPQRK